MNPLLVRNEFNLFKFLFFQLFQAGGLSPRRIGELVSEAAEIDTAAVYFNQDDFIKNLVGCNRFIEVEGGIAAK